MVYIKIKSFLDRLISFCLIIFLLPLLFLIALSIVLTSKGPIIFVQNRLGIHGRKFKIFKFRTMTPNSENEGIISTRNDKRITPIGKLLRITSLDELPQLFNILIGDMSFIGPRPILTYYPKLFNEYDQNELQRFSLKPGITGLAQIKGRKSINWDKRFAYDVRYINEVSIFLDLKIIIITIFKVLFLKDVYNIENNNNLLLMYITNNPNVALIAEKSGVDWIFIDLETLGKKERQINYNTLISNHSYEDIKVIKNILTKSKLLVRVNPINENSKKEIDTAINNGASILMLPYFKTLDDVKRFISYVQNRSEICLLVETVESFNLLHEIVKLDSIGYIHIGLNDLHIQLKKKFMFELVSEGLIDTANQIINKTAIKYGFGGIADLDTGLIPGKFILEEHKRLKSSMVILSRSFINLASYSNLDSFEKSFVHKVKSIRDLEFKLNKKGPKYFRNTHLKFVQLVQDIVKKI